MARRSSTALLVHFPPIDMGENLGDSSKGGDRDLVADIEGRQNLDQIGILAHSDAMGEGEFEDLPGDGTAAGGEHTRRRRPARLAVERYGFVDLVALICHASSFLLVKGASLLSRARLKKPFQPKFTWPLLRRGTPVRYFAAVRLLLLRQS